MPLAVAHLQPPCSSRTAPQQGPRRRVGWLPQTSSLAVPTLGPASPHRPCGKHQPWDVCSWFFCLPLCLLRCCSLPATILEGFPGGTPTRAAGSGWEVRSRKQWHCICPYTEQCPVQEGPAGAIFQPCSPCDFGGTPCTASCCWLCCGEETPRRVPPAVPRLLPSQGAAAPARAGGQAALLLGACNRRDPWLPAELPPVPAGVRAPPGKPLAVMWTQSGMLR